jgi:hypothetical protein
MFLDHLHDVLRHTSVPSWPGVPSPQGLLAGIKQRLQQRQASLL